VPSNAESAIASNAGRLLASALYAAGIALLAGVLFAHIAIGQGLGPIKVAVLCFALAFFLVAPLASKWPGAGMAGGSALFTLFACLIAYAATDVPVYLLDAILKPIPGVHIWEFHPRYGYGHKAKVRDTQATREYSVTYTIDEDRCRRSYSPGASAPEVLVLGDSFAFGQGVQDDETFAWRLGEEHWKDYRVRNCAVSGWGTAHAYLRLEEILANAETPPKLVLYTLIEGDLYRNYIRKEWLEHVSVFHVDDPEADTRGYHPHFEIEGGTLVFKGLASRATALPASEELAKKEIALTSALIEGMARMAESRGAAFATVVLPAGNGARLPAEVPEALRRAGCELLDLSDRKAEVYKRDRHPTPKHHAQLAAWIAESPIRRHVGR